MLRPVDERGGCAFLPDVLSGASIKAGAQTLVGGTPVLTIIAEQGPRAAGLAMTSNCCYEHAGASAKLSPAPAEPVPDVPSRGVSGPGRTANGAGSLPAATSDPGSL